ncbi:diacylglycerol kinase family protein [Oricola sp.]|uniref:diacylglycerol/lipid kinase family protein n=1 Tax=Oricola sp. TaxID=1979950 RepID=UPI0025DA5DE9|nr:diacylglycerol kinase family protein [Oricola sp.]MCI5074223.1 diacylglycerol kinase family lipid kinase [Oricola sp.]
MRYIAVLNRDASSLKTADLDALVEQIETRFGEEGHTISVTLHEGKDLPEALGEAARSAEADAILAGGGDGTISLAAGIAHDAKKALAILPGGNMNLFARSLGIPLDLEAAVDAVASGKPAKADIAFANDRPFIHEFSLGLRPKMIALRDRQSFGSRIGKLMGSVASLWRVLMRPPRVRVWFDDGHGNERRLVTAGLAISNNPFGEGHLPYADRVDGGVLGVYLAHTVRPAELAAIAARLSTGDWAGMPQMERFTTTRLRLTRRGTIRAAMDGELVHMHGPVEIRTAPGALTVIAPDEDHARRGQ